VNNRVYWRFLALVVLFFMPANSFNAYTNYGIGIGLRVPHYQHILSKKPVVDWFEIISENFMVDAGRPLEVLDQILEQYRVVQHGVSMYFGSSEKLNREHLKKLKRLVKRTTTSGVHNIQDTDQNPGPESEKLARKWAEEFGAKVKQVRVSSVSPSFEGTAILRVRATVAHDSYERLVPCTCDPEVHRSTIAGADGLAPIERTVRKPAAFGIDIAKLQEAGERDDAIAEFKKRFPKVHLSILQGSPTQVAEMVKLLENTFRMINISINT